MCGIFGIAATAESNVLTGHVPAMLRQLYLLSETRGKDASGLALADTDRIAVLKNAVRARKLTASADFCQLVDHFDPTGAHLVMGHSRMVTNGSAAIPENNQPVIKDGLVCIHNGIVVNDAALWDAWPQLERRYEVDTEIILSLITAFRQQGHSLNSAFVEAFRQIDGANSIALVADDTDALLMATSNGSLFTMHADGAVVFASERYILEQMRQHFPIFRSWEITQLRAGTGFTFSFDTMQPQPFDLSAPLKLRPLPAHSPSRDVQNIEPSQPARPPVFVSRLPDLAANDAFLRRVNDAVAALRRCTRCLLPETFPYIRFDEDGVCHFCQAYQPLAVHGDAALRDLLEPLRSANGQPDCLVPISGGRDSCYGLHYIKNELDMNPVAYTYDWGMVTDLARRNISRMCGALGIEHVLISADIRSKRRNIRQNVNAWLRRPALGTVPLFMAGDKQFFYYANMLKQQMRLGITLFSMNRLERTDFKVAFCGIDETKAKQEKHYALSQVNQARMAFYYAGEFLQNPAYFNRSLLDSAFAFFSYYMIDKDYLTLYDYIRWNEQQVVDVLLDLYDWETAPDTRTTWRIGDGTASFYNYIYYVLAGFSENDTFRSNQVREGMITREEALKIAHEDNQPRYDSIRWYCETIGVDFAAALQRINAAPKRYAL